MMEEVREDGCAPAFGTAMPKIIIVNIFMHEIALRVTSPWPRGTEGVSRSLSAPAQITPIRGLDDDSFK
jgi:hypothetical protein